MYMRLNATSPFGAFNNRGKSPNLQIKRGESEMSDVVGGSNNSGGGYG